MDKLRQKREKECVEQYKKKLTIVSKKKRIGLIVTGSVLLAGAGGTGGYFAYKAATRLPDVVVDGYVIKFNDTTLKDLKVKKGETLNLKDIKPTKDKYTFMGWYYDKGLTRACPDTIVVNNDLTIYAKWVKEISSQGLGFILNATGDSYSVYCSDEEELYSQISAQGYELTIPDECEDKDTNKKLPVTNVGFYNAETELSYGFENCTKIKKIAFGKNVQTIAPKAFKGCIGLNNVTIEGTIYSIGDEAFANCISNKSFDSSKSSLTEIGSNAFSDNYSLTDVKLNSDLLRLSSGAFKNCATLSNVTFDDNSKLLNIGESCFESCVNLTTCQLPYSIVKINASAFKTCPSNITFKDEISSWCKSDGTELTEETIKTELYEGRLIYKDSIKSTDQKLSFYIIGKVKDKTYNVSAADNATARGTDTDVIIPSSFDSSSGDKVYVTRIAEQGFKDSNITSVKIPNTVETIGADAFNTASALETVEFTDSNTSSLKAIGDNAFRSTKITSINLPEGLVSIGADAFCFDFYLTDITIPSTVKEMKYSYIEEVDMYDSSIKYKVPVAPFNGLHQLKSIDVSGSSNDTTYKSVNGVLFEKNSGDNTGYTLLRFPEANTAAIADKKYIIPDDETIKTTIIAAGSFYEVKTITTIDIPDSVVMISDRAFAGRTDDNIIENVNINSTSNIKYIGVRAFENTKITNINLNLSKLETINDYAFHACSKLKEITIPKSVSYIGCGIIRGLTIDTSKIVFEDKDKTWSLYNIKKQTKVADAFKPVDDSGKTIFTAKDYLRGNTGPVNWTKNS